MVSLKAAIRRASQDVDSYDPDARNLAFIFLRLARVAELALSVRFEQFALAGESEQGDALLRDAALFDLNDDLDDLSRCIDIQEFDEPCA